MENKEIESPNADNLVNDLNESIDIGKLDDIININHKDSSHHNENCCISELVSKEDKVNRIIKQVELKEENNYNFSSYMNMLITSSFRLMKMNEEFLYLIIMMIIWLGLILFEFLYGFLESKVDIVSDSFFNYFKTLSFIITGISMLFSKVYSLNNNLLKNRIELIAALSNIIFLTMVGLHMCIESLHLLTEDMESKDYIHDNTIDFLNNFNIIKIIINVLVILKFSDYLIHPSLQIKILHWKRHKQWKNISSFTFDELKEAKLLVKSWNNHFENMNVLLNNLLSDIISSTLFIICLYVSKNNHYEYIHSVISIVNFVLIVVLVYPSFISILRILMQGRSSICSIYEKKVDKEVSYFEGCSGVREIKFWLVAQNEIKCYIRLLGSSDLNRNALKDHINNIINELEIDIEITFEITN